MANQNKSILFLLVVSLLCRSSCGHRGLLTRGSCDNDFGSSQQALPVPDASISWAFKHYFDCSQRAVWARFKNPAANFKFYVGAGVPPVKRMSQLRADAIIIGPGLPKLSADEIKTLPTAVRDDPIFSGDNATKLGAVIFRSPEDQSTCAHLGTVMKKNSKVVNGRCDFYEPYGRTHSWRVLDADNNVLPVEGAEYYVAVWLQKHQSGKVGVALGTWKENFRTPMKITTPSCVRDMSDFSEKTGNKLECFPVVTCPTRIPISRTRCEARGVGAERMCPANKKPTNPSRYNAKMGCGGSTECPNAVKLWDSVNMRMHLGMALSFSGNVAIDFVRGMIPHHRGALEMCEVLVEKLSCMKVWDPAALDGLVHFCTHVRMEQNREIEGLIAWLKAKGLAENTTCVGARPGTHDGHKHGGRRRRAGEKDAGHKMSDGCGHVNTPSAAAFIKANRAMHTDMRIRFSCDHSVDFVRGMIPHHKGAVAMCEVLTTHVDAEADEYLVAFCANVTRVQRAEIAWMSKWLDARSHSRVAPCGTCSDNKPFVEPPLPCEDTLSTSSFCHLLGGDLYCRCADAVDDGKGGSRCGGTYEIEGFGTMNVSAECSRTCGLCGRADNRPPLFSPQQDLCPRGHSFVADNAVDDDNDAGDGHKHKEHPHSKEISGSTINLVSATMMVAGFLMNLDYKLY